MKKLIILTLVCIVLMAVGGVPSQSIFAMTNTNMQGQDGTSESLAIASFNIQFLGSSTKRDDPNLAMILKDFDVVVIQELIAPPYKGKFPDNTDFKPDKEAAEFFDAMSDQGFKFELSIEDTGSGPKNHINSSATEWWAVFYKANKVIPADGLPTEFLAADRTDHEHYERVPYAFAFRSPEGNLDFVIISVHLMPGGGEEKKERRKEELTAIAKWVDVHDDKEKDFIILGDMNIEDCEELREVTPAGFLSLNDECEATNTNVNGPKPYDHVMYRPAFTKEIDKAFDFRVFNLIEAMRPFWSSTDPYPGGAVNPIGLPKYNHDKFRAFYSDHHPVVYKLTVPGADDD